VPVEPGFAAGQWSRWGERRNMGVVLGPSGLVVVEYDDPDAEP
jgi:Bifunctional DNA primase/polymerase, N-terminal